MFFRHFLKRLKGKAKRFITIKNPIITHQLAVFGLQIIMRGMIDRELIFLSVIPNTHGPQRLLVTTDAVVLSQGTEDLQLELPDNLTLEVQVENEEKKRKGTEHSLEIELKWYDNDQSAKGLTLK